MRDSEGIVQAQFELLVARHSARITTVVACCENPAALGFVPDVGVHCAIQERHTHAQGGVIGELDGMLNVIRILADNNHCFETVFIRTTLQGYVAVEDHAHFASSGGLESRGGPKSRCMFLGCHKIRIHWYKHQERGI